MLTPTLQYKPKYDPSCFVLPCFDYTDFTPQAKVALRSSNSAVSQQYQLMQPMQQQQLTSQHSSANSVLSAALQPNAHTSSAAAMGHALQHAQHAQQARSSVNAAETAPAEALMLPMPGMGELEQPPLGGAGARARSESPAIGRTSSIAGKAFKLMSMLIHIFCILPPLLLPTPFSLPACFQPPSPSPLASIPLPPPLLAFTHCPLPLASNPFPLASSSATDQLCCYRKLAPRCSYTLSLT